MKKLFLFTITLLLISCASHIKGNFKYSIESKKIDYFEEWGILRLTGRNVLSNASKDFSAADVGLENLCNTIFETMGFYGGRLYLDDSTGKVSIECLSQVPPIKSKFSEKSLFGRMLTNKFISAKDDSLYYILYGGNEMRLQSGADIHQRLVCQEERIDSCPLDKKFEKKRDNIYFKGPFYELSIPANRPFFSITELTNPKDLEGYKPLKLDPSILPLESPGYKKLREQEEALGRK